ncbi:MAG: asparaginase [Variovorax sp.]
MTSPSTKPRLPERCVIVLGSGGTISGRAAASGDHVGYVAGQVSVEDLLAEVAPPPGICLRAEQVAQIDSKDMSFDVWRALALRCAHWLAKDDVVGVVITHGTDTLEETAFFLQLILAPAKSVVLTCAMRPATALAPDGPQNVQDAIAVAASGATLVKPGERGASGVVVLCAGTVHSAFDVQKVHTYRLDAFDSGDAGPLAYVEQGAVRQLRQWPQGTARIAPTALREETQSRPWPRVEIVMSHAGAGGGIIDLLLQQRAAGAPDALQGLVLAATGNGTLHRSLEEAALRAQAAGVRVLRATRCAQGQIMGKAGALLPNAGALTPVKARISLLLDLLVEEGHSASRLI